MFGAESPRGPMHHVRVHSALYTAGVRARLVYTRAQRTQFFFGPSILVSPVTEENATSVSIYLPDDIFYDFHTFAPIRGNASYVDLEVNLTSIPVHIRGGTILPLRAQSAMTTTELRKQDFEIIVAPGLDGSASGSLYLDDGVSVVQDTVSEIDFKYENGKFSMTGSFEYDAGVNVETITLLGVDAKPDGAEDADYDDENKKLVLHVDEPLTGRYEATIA